MTVQVISIQDPFRPLENKKDFYEYEDGKCLDYYLSHIDLDNEDIFWAIAINGDSIDVEKKFSTIPIKDEDIIAVSAQLMASVAAATIAGFAAAAAGGTISYAAYMAIYVATYLVSTLAVGFGISVLASALGPDNDAGNQDTTTDPIFGWGDLRQTTGEGNRIPLLFGKTRISGETINTFTELDSNDETLSVMLGICDHEVDSITDIYINDNPTSYYQDVEEFTRLGTINDDPIPGFDEVVTQTDIGSRLAKNVPVTQTTGGSAVEKLTVTITAPNGLYYTNNSGGLDTREATFLVEYKASSDSTWISHSTTTISNATTETQRRAVVVDNLPANSYDIRVTRTNDELATFKGNNTIYFSNLKESVKESFIYPGLAKYAVKILATDQLSGSTPTFSCVTERSTVQVWDESLATPLWVQKRATNPAWIVYSLLTEFAEIPTDKIIWDDFKDWADYCDEDVNGKYRCEVNIILYNGSYWSEINKVAKYGRAAICRRGTRYGVFVDKEEDNISAMFNMGNILPGTFNMSYLPKADRSNAVDVEYTDPDRDYTRQVVSVYSDDYLTTGEAYASRANISFEAVISQEMAVREGVYKINSNKYLSRTIKFDAFVDSFACTVGDLFYFQHQIPSYEYGVSGRLIDAGVNGNGNSYIVIDQPLDFSISGPYMIRVRLGDGSFVEKTVTGSFYAVYEEDWEDYEEDWGDRYIDSWSMTDVTATVLFVSPAWTTIPEKYDIYSLATVNVFYKTFRLISVDRRDDFIRSITGIEYVDEIYTHNDSYVIEEPIWETRKPRAINTQINEFLSYSGDGGYQSNLNINWDKAYTKYGSNWTVWIEDLTAGTTPSKAGDAFSDSFVIMGGLVLNHEYKVYIAAYGEGAKDTGDNTAPYTILGKLAPPGDIVNFGSSWNSITRQINFTWSALSEIDLSHYELRYGSSWSGGSVIGRPTDNYFDLYVQEKFEGSRMYWIKAVDTSGIYSTNASNTTVTIDTGETPLLQPGNLQLTTASDITSDGTNVVSLTATWNDAAEASDYFSHYDIILRNVAVDSNSMFSTSARNYRWEIIPVTEYGVTIRAVDTSGNFTDWIEEVKITSAKDTSPPSAPTNLIAGGTWTNIMLTWTHGGELDLSHFDVYRHTSDDSAASTVVGSSVRTFSGTIGTYVDAPETDDVYYYWVKAVDSSGNVSGFSNVDSAEAAGVDIKPGSITETEIADDAISTPKLRANSVIADKIAAGQIGTSHLIADAVTASKISVTTLSAIAVDAGTITAGRLQNSANSTYLDLDNNTMKLGSKFTWDGVNLSIPTGCVTVGLTDLNSTVIDNGKIATNLVVANSITSGSVTATKIDVDNLSSMSIYSGTITVNSTGYIKSAGKDSPTDPTAGFYLGYSGGYYQLAVGNSTEYMKWNGTNLSFTGSLGGSLGGDLFEAAYTNEVFVDWGVWTKHCSFQVGRGGTWRLRFEHKGASGTSTFARVYKNGVAYGTIFSTNSSNYVTQSEDLVFEAYDTAEIWVLAGGYPRGYIRNCYLLTSNPLRSTVVYP